MLLKTAGKTAVLSFWALLFERVHNLRSTMNRLASILFPAQVLVRVEVTSKKRAFEEAGL